jgi:hypothetical protein
MPGRCFVIEWVKSIVDVHFTMDVATRRVRFLGTERDNPAHGYSIVELAVFRDRGKGSSRQ